MLILFSLSLYLIDVLCLLICKCYINLAFLDKIAIAHHFGFYLLKCRKEFLYISVGGMDFPCGSAGKESVCYMGHLGSTLGLGRSPGKGMAIHSSILAQRIP